MISSNRRASARKYVPANARGRIAAARSLGVTLALAALAPLATAAEDRPNEGKRPPEPIVTEETLPNEAGVFTARLGFDHRSSGGDASGTRPVVTLFYGMTERFGVSLRVPVSYRREDGSSAHGLGDISLGLKRVLVPPRGGAPAIVLGLEAEAPSGDDSRDLGEGVWEVEPFVGLLKDFGAVSLQGNLTWSKQLTKNREQRFGYNWALAAPFRDRRLCVLLELNGEFVRRGQSAVSPGLKWSLGDEAFVALATMIPLNSHTPRWGLVAQAQVRLK